MQNKIIIALAFLIVAQSVNVQDLGLTVPPEDFEFTDDYGKLNINTPLVFFGEPEISEGSSTYYLDIKDELYDHLQSNKAATIKQFDDCLESELGVAVETEWFAEVGVIAAGLTAAQVGEIKASTKACIDVDGSSYTVSQSCKAITADTEFDVPEGEMFTVNEEESAVGSWNIDRINQKNLPLDKNYAPNLKQPAEVHVYIADTGIDLSHNDLKEQAAPLGKDHHFSAYGGSRNGNHAYDGHGHGTHVSGTTTSKRWGYFHNSVLHAVKILSDSGSGSYSGIINGLNWVVGHVKAHGKPSVINMSIGGGKNQALNDACNRAVQQGIHTVVAAGNSNRDSAYYSPASAKDVITVGSSDSSDRKSSFSNYGTSTNIWAGGSAVTSCIPNQRTATWSGTSMASPTVCGVVATLASLFPKDNHEALKKKLYCMMYKNKIGSSRSLLQDTKGECWKDDGGGGKCNCSEYSDACNSKCGAEGEGIYVKDMQCWTHWLKKQCTKCLCSNNNDVTGDIDNCGNQCRYSFLS